MKTEEMSDRDHEVTMMALVYGIAALQGQPREHQRDADLRVMTRLALDNQVQSMWGLVASVEQKLGQEINLWAGWDESELTPDDIIQRDKLRTEIGKVKAKVMKFYQVKGSTQAEGSASRQGAFEAPPKPGQ